jgi:hypothetical protein
LVEVWRVFALLRFGFVVFFAPIKIPKKCGSGALCDLTLTLSLSKLSLDLESTMSRTWPGKLKGIGNQSSPALMVDGFESNLAAIIRSSG